MSDSRQLDLETYIERLARPTPPVTTQDRELAVCSFDGCGGRLYALGLCNTHYKQNERTGSLSPIVRKERPELCEFQGCRRKHYGHGLCGGHHQQRVAGKALTALLPGRRMTSRDPVDEFFDRVSMEPMSGCWLWCGPYGRGGYGNFTADGAEKAHQVSLIWFVGPRTPEKPWALHRCDNPPCVNPRHLYWGTAQDNARDMVTRGRTRSGSVPTISAEVALDGVGRGLSQRAVAAELGVTQSTVSRAIKRASDEQQENLTRVTSRIGTAIHAFCAARVGKTFTAAELREHVATACGTTAPASADRVLRQLRKQGVVAYRVVSRSASTYLVEGA